MKDEVFKALADPTRRRILRMLGDGERTAGEIATEFPIRAPRCRTISRSSRLPT